MHNQQIAAERRAGEQVAAAERRAGEQVAAAERRAGEQLVAAKQELVAAKQELGDVRVEAVRATQLAQERGVELLLVDAALNMRGVLGGWLRLVTHTWCCPHGTVCMSTCTLHQAQWSCIP